MQERDGHPPPLVGALRQASCGSKPAAAQRCHERRIGGATAASSHVPVAKNASQAGRVGSGDNACPLPTSPIEFAIYCGATPIQHLVIRDLEQRGFRHNRSADVALILELPYPFAWAVTWRLAAIGDRAIVVTWNRCPEYCDTLWDMGPCALVDGESSADLAAIVAQVAAGGHFRDPALAPSPLAPIERQVLHLLALGHSSQQIAEQTGLQHQTVRNSLVGIYHTLGLPDAKAALLYYWNTWPANARFPKQVKRRSKSR